MGGRAIDAPWGGNRGGRYDHFARYARARRIAYWNTHYNIENEGLPASTSHRAGNRGQHRARRRLIEDEQVRCWAFCIPSSTIGNKSKHPPPHSPLDRLPTR